MHPSLVPGVNVDVVNVERGMARAAELGYATTWRERMVIDYALRRWGMGEEEGADRTFLSQFPHALTDWRAILASAIA